MRISKVFFMAAFVFYTAHASAWSFAELLGLDKIGKDASDNILEAARAVAKETAASMIESSRNITIMTNQFGVLIADYHGTDQKRKAEAKSIIEGVFWG